MKNKRRFRPVVVGVTGGMGSGKSTVSAMFKKFGAKVLDADKIAHLKMKKGERAYKKIIKEFGKSVLARSGEIERRKLADIVFKDKKALNKLCAIVHPEVIKYAEERVKKASKSPGVPAIIIDAPLLIEAGMDKMADALIVVKASAKTQIERYGKKTGLDRAGIKRRAQNQIPLKKKLALADYVIDNEGCKEDTRRIVGQIWREIKSGRNR